MNMIVMGILVAVALAGLWAGARQRGAGRRWVGAGLWLAACCQLMALGYQSWFDHGQPDADLEVVALRRANLSLTRTNTNLDADVTDLAAALKRQSGDAATFRQSEADRQMLVLAQLRDIGADRRPVRRDEPTPTSADEPAVFLRRQALIVQEIERIKQAEAMRVSTPGQDDTRDLLQLRDKMAVRMDTPSYTVEIYPDTELVKGRKGKYYAIDLKDADAGVRFRFDGGRYTLDRRNDAFRSSLNKFLGEVVSTLQGKVSYDLLVRGSADAVAFRNPRQLEADYDYQQIKFMSAIPGGDRYSTVLGEQRVNHEFRNEDLPNLRAAYLQDVIGKSYAVQPPIVLEGTVTKKADKSDRNAEIFLFVSW